jgi:hypothetical protein
LTSIGFLATLFINEYFLFTTQENKSPIAKKVVLEETEENTKICEQNTLVTLILGTIPVTITVTLHVHDIE